MDGGERERERERERGESTWYGGSRRGEEGKSGEEDLQQRGKQQPKSKAKAPNALRAYMHSARYARLEDELHSSSGTQRWTGLTHLRQTLYFLLLVMFLLKVPPVLQK